MFQKCRHVEMSKEIVTLKTDKGKANTTSGVAGNLRRIFLMSLSPKSHL